MSQNPNREQSRVINSILGQLSISRGNLQLNRAIFDPFVIKVAGFAGTGKTFTICRLRQEIYRTYPNCTVAFVTFTGKASSVLREKLNENGGVFTEDFVGTIHSLIYKPITKWDRQLRTFVITGWDKKSRYEVQCYDLIIIDEASMVSKDIWNDLVQYDIPVVAVGDHGQLPPIGDKFNLLNNPDFILTKIERQALNSPIIYLSQLVRRQGYIPENTIYSPKVFKISWQSSKCQELWQNMRFNKDVISLCGFNVTRSYLNDKVRNQMGRTKKEPYPGERVVCLANDHDNKIMNGQIFNIIWVMPDDNDLYRMTMESDNGEMYELMVSNKCFGQVQYTVYDKTNQNKDMFKQAVKRGFRQINYFDYGYCISVHKSQGSEWNKVILFEQRSRHWDDEFYARWLYTAITRAREGLFIISDFFE